MYEFILTTKLLTAVTALLLAIAASLVVGRGKLWWRGLMLNFSPMIAAAFFVLAPFAANAPDSVDVLSGLALELTVLWLIFRLLRRLLGELAKMRESESTAYLRVSLVAQMLLVLPIVGTEGFGIFSTGTRLDYLYAGPLAKYFTYAGLLITLLQAAFLAHRISQRGNPGWLGAVVILTNFALSVVAGSKGGSFLWLLSSLALVDYRRAHIKLSMVLITVIGAAAALTITANVIAGFLGISVFDFFELATSRFFLTNDARALAFDMRSMMTADSSLFGESFRSLATLFGSPPHNPPLGLQLYGDLFGELTGNGANASLMALVVYYFPAGYALVPTLLFICGMLVVYLAFDGMRKAMRRPSSKVVVLSLAIFAINQMSQDFLAFQVVMPLMCLAIAALWIHDRREKRSSRARPRSSHHAPVFAHPDQRHRPGL